MTIESKVFGDSDLMVKQGEVRKADGLDDVVEDIFSEERPRTSRFDIEEELKFIHEKLDNLKTFSDRTGRFLTTDEENELLKKVKKGGYFLSSIPGYL